MKESIHFREDKTPARKYYGNLEDSKGFAVLFGGTITSTAIPGLYLVIIT
jgi:hypothetical protein